jgi:sulfur-oxidizing protein SoxY
MMKRYSTNITLCACASLMMSVAAPTRADDDDASARLARWNDIKQMTFGIKASIEDENIIKLDAPPRAEDAALVPVTIKLNVKASIKALYVVVDDNPAPMAAHYVFGPAAYPDLIKMRVRVNSYTNMHAVAQLQDGTLVEAVSFVKASGGCSAPMGVSGEEAMENIGDIRMKFAGSVEPGKPMEATLMVRHPNFNGMQMDQETHGYTPARYIKTIKVMEGDELVLALKGDISLSSNPVISFGLIPHAGGQLTVVVDDSEKSHWEKSFRLPAATN